MNSLLLIPITYIVVKIIYWIGKKHYSLTNIGIGNTFFETAAFIKYFFMPLLMVYTEEYYTIGPLPSNRAFSLAINLTIYEFVLIYLSRYIFLYKRRTVFSAVANHKLNIKSYNYSFILPFSIFVFVFCSFLFPEIWLPKFYIFGEKSSENSAKIPLLSMFVSLLKYFTYIVFLYYCLFRYKKHKQTKIIYIAIVIFFFYLGMFLGESRWTIIYHFIATFLLAYFFIGKPAKRFAYFTFFPFVAVIFLISFYKFQDQLIYFNNPFKGLINVLMGQFQSYFSGPNLIAQSIDMIETKSFKNDITWKTCVNDFIGSIPGISYIVDQMNRTNIYFNQYLLGEKTKWFTQIIPATSIGYIYAGKYLSPIFTVVANLIGLFFDLKIKTSKITLYTYVYIYIAMRTSLSICFNTQIIFGGIFSLLLPLLLVIFIMSKFKISFSGKKTFSIYSDSYIRS